MKTTPYKNALIFFWSGTGNSYRVSTWLGKTAEENGLTARILSIDQSNQTENVKGGTNRLIGFVYPTHGFTAPWHIVKFIWRLPKGNSIPAFCIATRAGLKFGPVLVPGIGGSATFIIALILIIRGYNVRGLMSVDMPSNWYSLHPIQRRKSHVAIINRAKQKVARFMERILQNGRVWFTANNLFELAWGIILSLISLGYLFFGRFFLAKLFFANNKCNGCGVCAGFCSLNAIKMWGKRHPRPFWKYNCESCMRCSAFCPLNAIEAGHSWGVILYFIAGVPVLAYLFSWLNGQLLGIENLEGHWINDILNLMYYYPAIFISYYIFYALLRIPLINWIFTYTTMTHLPMWGRYREPNTKLSNIESGNKNIDDKLNQN